MISTWGAIKPLASMVRDVLNKFGTGAHRYLAGIGSPGGFVAGNYQDSAGTTQAVVDQPVGLVLDAAGSVGSELVAYPLSGAASGTWAVDSNGITRNGSTTGQACFALVGAQTLPATKTYKMTFTVSNFSGDSIGVRCGGGTAYGPISANGTYSYRVTGGGSTSLVVIPWAGTTGQCTVSLPSIKEVTGIHVSQSTAGNRPTLRSASGKYYHEYAIVSAQRLTLGLAVGWTNAAALVFAIKPSGLAAQQFIYGETSGGAQLYISVTGAISFDKNGTGALVTSPISSISANETCVITAWLSGGVAKIRKNGVEIASSSSAVTFNGTSIGSIGASSGLFPFGGFNYDVVLIKGDASLSDIKTIEKSVGQSAGIAI